MADAETGSVVESFTGRIVTAILGAFLVGGTGASGVRLGLPFPGRPTSRRGGDGRGRVASLAGDPRLARCGLRQSSPGRTGLPRPVAIPSGRPDRGLGSRTGSRPIPEGEASYATRSRSRVEHPSAYPEQYHAVRHERGDGRRPYGYQRDLPPAHTCLTAYASSRNRPEYTMRPTVAARAPARKQPAYVARARIAFPSCSHHD